MATKFKRRIFEERHVLGAVDPEDSVSMQRLKRMLNNTLFLRCLYLDKVHNFDWLREFSPFRSTRCLVFTNCTVTTNDFTKLVDKFPLIEDLKMKNTTPEVDSVSVEQITKWKALRHISLTYDTPSHVSDTDTDLFFSIITTQCQNLSTMLVENRLINDASFTSFSQRHGPFMKCLMLSAEYLTGLSYDSLSLYKKLTTIVIEHAANMTNENLLSILRLERLRELQIADGRLLFCDNFNSLFKNNQFRQLRELVILRCDHMDDEALFILVNCCPLLKKLYLRCLIAITEQGLLQIVQFCSCLELLWIANCSRILIANAVEQISAKFDELGMKCPKLFIV